MKMKLIAIFSLFFTLAIAGCDNSQKARDDLASLGISYDVETLAKHIKDGDIEIVNLFIEAGINPNIKVDVKKAGYFAPPEIYSYIQEIPILLIALERENKEIIDLLLDAGANKDQAIAAAKTFQQAEERYYKKIEKKAGDRLFKF